jgi:hypothetical protein
VKILDFRLITKEEIMNRFSLITLTLMLTACASQSGVLQTGVDTYQVSATASPARGGATGARKIVLTRANEKCNSLGKQIDVINTQSSWAFPAATTVVVDFRCVAK